MVGIADYAGAICSLDHRIGLVAGCQISIVVAGLSSMGADSFDSDLKSQTSKVAITIMIMMVF